MKKMMKFDEILVIRNENLMLNENRLGKKESTNLKSQRN